MKVMDALSVLFLILLDDKLPSFPRYVPGSLQNWTSALPRTYQYPRGPQAF